MELFHFNAFSFFFLNFGFTFISIVSLEILAEKMEDEQT